MNRRTFVTAAAGMVAQAAQSGKAGRPNVIVVITDDQGYGDFSCHGNPVLKTPNMDRLHATSARFTDFHVAPMCTPTRGELMTGMDALRNGATSVTAGRAVIRRGIPTVADALRAGGYRTGMFGKWHLGDNYPYRPMERGFETANYHLGFGMSSAPDFDNDYFNGTYRDNGVPKRFEGYCTDFWFSQAMSWMAERQKGSEPFFCYLATNTPHGPAWVAEKYAAPYRKPGIPAEYFGMIANLDENIGKLDAFLEKSGLRENTILVFMTDNGATAGFKVFNAGMRARKTQIYDGGHRVPCFVRWPAGKLRTAVDIDVPVQVQDLFPTLLDLCGVSKPAKAKFDGQSLAPLLKSGGAKLPDRMMVVQYGQIPKKWESCVIWGKWRLVNGSELYDIKEDPGQERDVAAASPQTVARMRKHYESWWAVVEPKLNDFSPISIGSAAENPVALSCSDWQNVYADNPGHVSNAAGGPRGGPWGIYIERDGEYEIALSRWKPALNLPLTAGRAPQKMTVGSLPPGKAMPIAAARLQIADLDLSAPTKKDDKAATFRVKLKGGVSTRMQAWFQDASGQDLCGAFYATVRRL